MKSHGNKELDELLTKIESVSKDYMRNTSPYSDSVEEWSGFSSGVDWTVLKLYQMGVLKLNEEKEK